MKAPRAFLKKATRHLFFTGKGGVGKTSLSCAVAISLADSGKRVLLISTDPASNLDEVLGTRLSSRPSAIKSVPRLFALNIDPERAAREYRERVVGPYRKVLPKAAVASIEEQLSGACTTEIASFDEFSKLLGDPAETRAFDHVVFDTAPTGHTLRLMELPAAWSGFIESNAGGTSCLGPLSGLKTQQALYASAREALSDPAQTTVVLVSRPERTALEEAERTRRELAELSVKHLTLALNGIFKAFDSSDATANSLEQRGQEAMRRIPKPLSLLPRMELPLLPFALVGIDALRNMLLPESAGPRTPSVPKVRSALKRRTMAFSGLVSDLEALGRGVIMTMGKGGVGKTSVAVSIAVELAKRGHPVRLTTTDPAAHVKTVLHGESVRGLRISRIDPEVETRAYTREVLGSAGHGLDKKGRALLEEELRSPCTEEIAVFRAFARAVHEGKDGFVVIDTAPTGHTLLLLDAAEAYHREVSRSMGDIPEAVRRLLPRLRDRKFTRLLLVTLPEATPVHEAAALQADLERAGITPYAWVVNQSLTPVETLDPVLCARRANERRYIDEACRQSPRVAIVPWLAQDAGAGRLCLMAGVKELTVRWQRLVDGRGRTCPRCGETGSQVEKAVVILTKRLAPLGVKVGASSKALSRKAFGRDPSSSNRIWIGGKPIEHWLGAKTGKSRCCGACGTTPCRTVELGAKSYAAVPASLIIRAGQRAARSLLGKAPAKARQRVYPG